MDLEQEFAVARRCTRAVIERRAAAALRRIGPTAADRREHMERILELLGRLPVAMTALSDAARAAALGLRDLAAAVRSDDGKTNE